MSQNETPASVGQQLAHRRENLGLTQAALAQRIGIAAPTVSVTERGHTEIRVGKRPDWERALHLKPGTILRAYRDGTPLEPADNGGEPPYADLADEDERTVWGMNVSDDTKRAMIEALRSDRAREDRRRA